MWNPEFPEMKAEFVVVARVRFPKFLVAWHIRKLQSADCSCAMLVPSAFLSILNLGLLVAPPSAEQVSQEQQ